MNNRFIFIGPSLYLAEKPPILNSFTIEPPAKRGDIEKVSKTSDTGLIILADGIFQSCPAVGHKELLTAMERGWEVWGVSSMGAIRAYELRDCGMKGFGQVYQEFFKNPDLTDDEMALLHGPAPHYINISEPLINIRLFLKSKDLSEQARVIILEDLKSMYFGLRTMSVIFDRLKACTKRDPNEVFHDYIFQRAKTNDVLELLELQPWSRNL